MGKIEGQTGLFSLGRTIDLGESMVGGCNWIISVDVRPYFTGISLNIISTTNTTQNFTIA